MNAFLKVIINEANNILRHLYYPTTQESDLKLGKIERIGSHTDFGTLLLQNERVD